LWTKWRRRMAILIAASSFRDFPAPKRRIAAQNEIAPSTVSGLRRCGLQRTAASRDHASDSGA